MTFGEAIKQRRIELGMTIEQVSNTVKSMERGNGFLRTASSTVIMNFEADKTRPSDWIVPYIAKTLNMNEDWLFYLLGSVPPWLREANMDERDISALLAIAKHIVRTRERPEKIPFLPMGV